MLYYSYAFFLNCTVEMNSEEVTSTSEDVNAKVSLKAFAHVKKQFCNRKLTQLLKKINRDYTGIIAILFSFYCSIDFATFVFQMS